MLFYLEAKVSIRVAGISGPFEKTISWLVNANNLDDAKTKYKQQVRSDYAHMMPEVIGFEFLKMAGEIK